MAALPQWVPVKDADEVITRIQAALTRVFKPLLAVALLNGLSQDVTFNSANEDLLVTHGLGNAKGVRFLTGSLSAGGSVYVSPNNGNPQMNPRPERQILLRANMASLQATLWFWNA